MYPPRVGPRIGATSTATPNRLIAGPRFSGGKVSSRTPWVDGWSPPPENPWRTRNRISSGRLVAIPHRNELAVNPARDRMKYRFRPRWFDSHPDTGRMIAFDAR